MWKVDGHPRYMNHTQLEVASQTLLSISFMISLTYIQPADKLSLKFIVSKR